MEPVVIRKQKRSGAFMVWKAYEFTCDSVGTWLYTPEGSTVIGESGAGERAWSYVGVPESPGLHVLQLAPRSGWWIAHFTVHPTRGRCISIDIATPSALTGTTWRFDDLELDVTKRGEDGPVVEDEDEFEQALADGLISAHEADEAMAATRIVVASLTNSERPFDDLAWPQLTAAVKLALPPLLNH